MIIGIDASRANREHKSGTEWYSYYLIKHFSRLDDKNQYILYTDKPLKGGLVDLGNLDLSAEEDDSAPVYDKKGYQVLKSPFNNFRGQVLSWPFSYFWTLGRLSIEMLRKRPDVLFVPAHGLPLIRPKRTVNTIHDVAFRKEGAARLYEKNKLGPLDSRQTRRLINFLVKLWTRGKYSANGFDYLHWSTAYSLKHSKVVLTVSDYTRQEILRIYQCDNRKACSKEKIKVVHNGFNDLLFRKIEDQGKIEEVLKKYGIKRPYLLYTGRLERKKNTPFLIEAFGKAKLKNKDIAEKLVLVGDASFGYDEVKYLIDQYGLASEVLMTGWAEEKDLPYIFNGASAYILPSHHEGFGITILQAMGCGVPCLMSDIPVLREVADEAGIFFDPADKEDMARAIAKVLADPVLRKDLAGKGLRRAKEFSWEKCARETLGHLLKQ